jgi:hypothetical protein
MKSENESYPVLKDSRKAQLQTVSETRQVVEKKEENAVVHRSWLGLSTTTTLN